MMLDADTCPSRQPDHSLASAIRVASGYLRGAPADATCASTQELAEQASSVVEGLKQAIARERRGIVEDTDEHKETLNKLQENTVAYVVPFSVQPLSCHKYSCFVPEL